MGSGVCIYALHLTRFRRIESDNPVRGKLCSKFHIENKIPRACRINSRCIKHIFGKIHSQHRAYALFTQPARDIPISLRIILEIPETRFDKHVRARIFRRRLCNFILASTRSWKKNARMQDDDNDEEEETRRGRTALSCLIVREKFPESRTRARGRV